MAATIAVLSQKGGTGKTTTVRTLTDVFRSLGLEVLAVDLDPQGNLSDYLDVDPEAEPTIGDIRTIHSREAYANLREHYTAKVFRTPVRASIAYAESAERAVSIIDYRPDLGADYLALADEILARLTLGDARKRLQPRLAAA